MSGRERILLVEDDEGMRVACRKYLETSYEVREAATPQGAEAILLREEIQLVVTDLRMPGGGGEAVVRTVRSVFPALPVIIITAYPTVKSAIDLFKSGVVDYLVKPFTGEQLLECAERVLAERRSRQTFEALRPPPAADVADAEIAGSSTLVRRLLADVRRVATAAGPVLITGERGVRKVRAARAVHRHSARAGGPFVIVSCDLLPPDLLLADLFGYENHVFAGRPASLSGLAEEADHGTLFLDDVGGLTLEAQAMVLRLLDEGLVRRLGGVERRSVDIRVLASTSKDLHAETQASRFREDLYQRLSALEVRVPALRERREDIPVLAVQFLDRLNATGADRRFSGFTEDALAAMRNYDWPGNLRELQMAVEGAYTVATGSLISLADFTKVGAFRPGHDSGGVPVDRDEALAKFERQHLADMLARHGGNVTKTAEALGIHRTTLQRLMKRHGVERA